VETMVIELPSEFKWLGEAVKRLVDGVRRELGQCEGSRPVAYADVERRIGEQAAAIERAAHQAILMALARDEPVIEVAGRLYRRVLFEPGTYYTQAGPVTFERWLYREVGVRNGPVIDPVRLRAGTVEDGWLPATADAMAFEVQRGPAREAEASSRKHGRLPYSKSSFDRIAHAVARLYSPRADEIDAACTQAMAIPPEARSISVSIDRVSLPVEKPLPRPVGRPRKGAPKRPVEVIYQMAYCGTVTLHDGEGRSLHTIRYGRMPEPSGGTDVVAALAADVRAIMARRPDLEVALLCDGAHELWNLLGTKLSTEKLGRPVHQIVDFWHAVEKLGKAAKVICSSDAEASSRTARWAIKLKNSRHAVEHILSELIESGAENIAVGDSEPVHEAITYLTNHGDRMHYGYARCLGLPIGSGNVEATCKSLVEVRMKRGGARWKELSAQDILHLRALALSDRWDHAVKLALAPCALAVKAAA
jgi:hypothetical protein